MTTLATASAPLTVAEVKELAAQWYRKLDVHAPLVELLPLVDEDAGDEVPGSRRSAAWPISKAGTSA